MWTLILLLSGLFPVTGVSTNEVTAYSGGGVRITCKYEEGYEENKKYFCKGERRPCADQIKTGVKHTWVHEGRFSLYDDTSAKVFWVLMRNLTVEDSGTYQCGVDKMVRIDKYTPVELKVKGDLYNKKTITETGYTGGDVNISCNYPESHRSDRKLLCKTVDTDVSTYKTSVKESRRWINEGRVSLYEDRAKRTLTVTIRDVTEQDSGEYWCGAESGHGHTVYITRIYLRVTNPGISFSTSPPQPSSHISSQDTKPTTSSAYTPTSASSPDTDISVSTSPPQPSSHTSSQDTKPTTSSASTPTSVSSPDTGFSSSTVISVVSGILVLLLMGTAFLIFTLRNRSRKEQESSKGQSLQDSSHINGDPLSVCDYEEIEDTRSHSVSDTGAPTVYSTVCVPTNPSDSAVCDTQQSAGTSVEAPVYTTVKFYKNEHSSNDDVTKDPLAVCDYEEIKDTRSHSVSDTGGPAVYSTVCLPKDPL